MSGELANYRKSRQGVDIVSTKFKWIGGGCGVNGHRYDLSGRAESFKCEDTFKPVGESDIEEIKVLSRTSRDHFQVVWTKTFESIPRGDDFDKNLEYGHLDYGKYNLQEVRDKLPSKYLVLKKVGEKYQEVSLS